MDTFAFRGDYLMHDDQQSIRKNDDAAMRFTVLGSADALTGGNGSHVSDAGAGMRDPSSSSRKSYESLPGR
jgi:hypothetical protein